MIEAISLTKQYKKNSENALENFTFKFEKGKITGLVGANGAGKSTLLNILALRFFPTSGQIKINGIPVTAENYPEFKRNIGFVGENITVDGSFTVREILYNLCEFYWNEEKNEKYNRLIKDFSLEDVEQKKIRMLSKGYRQRLSFAMANANEPEILLLDEPISGLDPIQINEIRSMILKIKNRAAIIFSTHILQEIDLLCDSIIVIHRGKIMASGTEKEIIRQTGQTDIEKAFFALTADRTFETQKESCCQK